VVCATQRTETETGNKAMNVDNTAEHDTAFIEAYSMNVSDAPDDVVKEFLNSRDDHDKFYDEYSEYYSGLADAHGVWESALAYAANQVERLGIEGYGTLAIAAALRGKGMNT
jgi:hypothetical protein